MSFRFGLQRLLDLKAKREQALARELADARSSADSEQRRRDDLAALHTSAQHQLSASIAGAPSAGEIMSLAYSVAQLQARVEVADQAAVAAQLLASEAQGKLTTAMQERQTLDRLKDRKREAHVAEENARDQTAMDAIALDRFHRSRTTPSDSTDS